MYFVNRPVYLELIGNERVERVFVWIVADFGDIIAMVFLNELHGYLIDEFIISMMIAGREFIKDHDAWNTNVCSSLNILTSN